jgi:hypothetical protein
MKKLKILLMMLTITTSLSAQSRIYSIMVYIYPTAGGTAEERDYFDFNLQEEIIGAGYELTNDLYDDPEDARYYSDFFIEPDLSYDAENDEHIITLSLYNTVTDTLILSSDMAYNTLEDMADWNLTMIYRVMANAPVTHLTDEKLAALLEESAAGSEVIKDTNHWLRLGLRAGPSLRLYSPLAGAVTIGVGVDLGVQMMIQASRFLGLQFETIFTMDRVPTLGVKDNDLTTKEWSTTSFGVMIPVLLKGTFQVNRRLMINPFGGIYFWTPISKIINTGPEGRNSESPGISGAPLGVTVGFTLGIPMGPGSLLVDTRYAHDFGNTKMGDITIYQRNMISFTFGYELKFKEKTPRE